MMKNKLLNSLMLAAFVAPGVALAADVETTSHKEDQHVIPASEYTVTANLGLFSNYLYRGISQTGAKPAVQGGVDYAHSSGFYAGVWGSNISWISDVAGTASSASVELDTYFGFKGSFAEEFSYDVGFLRYNYPGVYASAATKADTNEIYGLIGWKWLTLKYSDSLGDTFGISKAGGTSYIDLSASFPLGDSGVTLGAHYGKQTYKGATADSLANTYISGVSQDPTYSDYKLSATKDFSGYVVGVAYSSTNAKKGGWYSPTLVDGSTVDTGKATVVLSVTHSM